MQLVTCAIIINKNRILITQRKADSDHPLKWEFPGGKLIAGETESDCIRREIFEELRLNIEIFEPMVPVLFDYVFREIRLMPFLCKIKSGKIVLMEHNDYKWVTLNELKIMDFAEADLKLIQLPENLKILKKYLWENMNDTR